MNLLAENGFEIFKAVLTSDECRSLVSVLNAEFTSDRAGSRNILRNQTVRSSVNNERLRNIAARSLGGSAIAYKAILFDKRNESNWLVPWHQDRVLPLKEKFADCEWGPWTQKDGVHFAHAPAWAMDRVVALRIHLDDSTLENGPLRVIAGSHRCGVLDQSDVVIRAKQGFEITCTVQQGDVIAMRPLLIHASSKSVSPVPRRVLHIEYASDLKLAENIELGLS
jgi:hypothetical protein